jgi:hypothetical protein
MWNDMENMEEMYFFHKTINTASNLFKFTVKGNSSVSEGLTL